MICCRQSPSSRFIFKSISRVSLISPNQPCVKKHLDRNIFQDNNYRTSCRTQKNTRSNSVLIVDSPLTFELIVGDGSGWWVERTMKIVNLKQRRCKDTSFAPFAFKLLAVRSTSRVHRIVFSSRAAMKSLSSIPPSSLFLLFFRINRRVHELRYSCKWLQRPDVRTCVSNMRLGRLPTWRIQVALTFQRMQKNILRE